MLRTRGNVTWWDVGWWFYCRYLSLHRFWFECVLRRKRHRVYYDIVINDQLTPALRQINEALKRLNERVSENLDA